MINGAHGTLLSLFLSQRTNKRSDEYGGSLQKRCRFACKVIAMVREKVGNNFALIFRMGGDDFVDGGITIEDAMKQAPLFVDVGADGLVISAGIFHVSAHMVFPTLLQEEGCRVHLADAIKKVVNVPIKIGRAHV